MVFQENWEEAKRTPFFEALETEVVSAELEGRSVIRPYRKEAST